MVDILEIAKLTQSFLDIHLCIGRDINRSNSSDESKGKLHRLMESRRVLKTVTVNPYKLWGEESGIQKIDD